MKKQQVEEFKIIDTYTSKIPIHRSPIFQTAVEEFNDTINNFLPDKCLVCYEN